MNIDCINTFEQFQDIKTNFETVYAADPKAQFFISWIWLSRVLKQFEKYSEPWLILAARPEPGAADYVAFLPLKIEICESSTGVFYNQLLLAGVTDAEQVPLICLPGYETQAVSALAMYLKQQETWSVFKMGNVQPDDERLRHFLSVFSNKEFDIQASRHFNNFDSIDNDTVPFVQLPTDWEDYLQTCLSANSRQRIKRFLRKVEASEDYQITLTGSSNLERHIEILRQFWEAAWEGRKGADNCRRLFDYIHGSLQHCFEHNCLYFPVLWKNEQPLGAIANILDHTKKTVLFLVGGRDPTVKDIPTGIVLHAYSIRDAIYSGFEIYNFLIGNEAYKYSFGAQDRSIRIVTVLRREPAANRVLDPATLPHALHIATAHHRANRLAEAEKRYRQILHTQPLNAEARYGLGVVLQRQEQYPAAADALNLLVEADPTHTRAWFGLGTLYQTQGQLEGAEYAYRKALDTQPETSAIALAIYHNLGYTLQQQARWDEAIACYEQARALQPDNREVEAIWASAMHTQGKLSAADCASYATLHQDLGDRRRQAGDLKVAVEYYRQAIALDPDLVDAHYSLGRVLQTLGHAQEAIVHYQTALTLQPERQTAEVNLAGVRHAMGALASEQQMHYANLSVDLGGTAHQLGNLEDALWFYRQAIALQPELALAHYKLGLVLQEQEKWAEALDSYQIVLELEPTHPSATLHCATAQFALGHLPAEQQAHYAALHHELGNQAKQAGNVKDAIEHFQAAIAMDPGLVEVREQLRLALQEYHAVQIKVSHAKR